MSPLTHVQNSIDDDATLVMALQYSVQKQGSSRAVGNCYPNLSHRMFCRQGISGCFRARYGATCIGAPARQPDSPSGQTHRLAVTGSAVFSHSAGMSAHPNCDARLAIRPSLSDVCTLSQRDRQTDKPPDRPAQTQQPHASAACVHTSEGDQPVVGDLRSTASHVAWWPCPCLERASGVQRHCPQSDRVRPCRENARCTADGAATGLGRDSTSDWSHPRN